MQRWIWLFIVSLLVGLTLAAWAGLPSAASPTGNTPGARALVPAGSLPLGGTPCPSGLTTQGWITAAEPTQVGRLERNGVTSVCGTAKPCPTVIDADPRHYRSHAFINNTAGPQCVSVSLTSGCSGLNLIFSAAYLGSFQPGNLCANYLGDIGTSPLSPAPGAYSFTVPAGAQFEIVVHEVNPNAGCSSYTLTVNGCVVPAGPSPTPTPSPAPTTPTPTCAPESGHWNPGAPAPAVRVQALGLVYQRPSPTAISVADRGAPDTFHIINRFLMMGGGNGNTPQQTIYEYTALTDSWSLKSAHFDDNHVLDMAGGTFPRAGGGSLVYTVGGWDPLSQTTSGEVRLYDPQTDVLTAVTTDPWPPGGNNTLPGGWTVWNNRLYIFGGYRVNSGMSDEIWEFNPASAPGLRWQRKNAHLPVPLGYLAVATIVDGIYLAGGATYVGPGTLADSALAYVYSPVGDAIAPISRLLAPVAKAHGVPVGGEFWVFGGGVQPPGPLNRVQIYNPGTDNWRWGPQFSLSRRAAAIDSVPQHYIFIAGGQTPFGPTAAMENYHLPETCGTPTPLPSPSPTPTACTVSFNDVPPNNPFYSYVRCLVCLGVVSGYGCGAPGEPCPGLYFRPGAQVTRGQLAKIIANALGITDPIPPGLQTFVDVVPANGFYSYVEWVAGHGILNGYQCGAPGEPCPGLYFRPNASATRGQIAKIVANAAAWTDTPTSQTFEDVPPTSTFYLWIERCAARGIISGYGCGGPGEPCVPPGNRPYFRPANTATRSQLAKITANAFFANCNPRAGTAP